MKPNPYESPLVLGGTSARQRSRFALLAILGSAVLAVVAGLAGAYVGFVISHLLTPTRPMDDMTETRLAVIFASTFSSMIMAGVGFFLCASRR